MSGRYEARFSAVGGQGVILAGDVLGLAAQKYEGRYSVQSPTYTDVLGLAAQKYEGRYSVQSPTYTAQVRGGPTKIDVIIDDEPIVYPKTTAINFFLSLAQGSYDAFFYDMRDDVIMT